ncbi:DUF3175 domain-containing protein [Paraburkholderia sp. DHOC27]|uniref:DUF3175 domain-containing protein n=1 Tax=Paraburkholderia sp. DHOC27 TaxID=2303330 RepID=UPI000E3DFEBB|nr:DUF3175 domain-containing protein [Paraburkholderia sp. DHOC27]RFU44653.1 DUF3175 domain-containing protein [Paraburkholderia sp. DHOC27]
MVSRKSKQSAKRPAKHPAARARSGRPPRQRHAQAHAHRRAKSAGGSTSQRSQQSQQSRHGSEKWSHQVMETSDAMDLEADIFKTGSAHAIAESLKRSSTHSRRRKGTPFQSAMSMLNFYINRAGKNLPRTRKATLEKAKRELRIAFGRAP